MPSKYQLFERSRLCVKPLAERVNDLSLDRWLLLDDPTPEFQHADWPPLRLVWPARDPRARRV